MSGDYSRRRFDPSRHYSGVLEQQGRVALDADHNEQVEIQDRRWRAETLDVIGTCGVPSSTPDAFKIGRAGGLTIGPGRIYVDGLLVENHATAHVFDPKLEELQGSEAIVIQDQPYGGPLLGELKGSRWLVYLVAWRREVTHLQDPKLIESAVNVETTTRHQTAWQVRLLEVGAHVTPQTPFAEIKNWPAENQRSAARLSTATVAVNTAPDPCLMPPSGGYRGLENHLYQVAIHEVGASGGLRVKWSRENANVATTVLEVLDGGTRIGVESLGRDDVLRFKTADWVEVTLDRRELKGAPGVMCRVTAVDDARQTLSLSPALPLADFPDGETEPADHVRVIRWDQSGIVYRADGTQLVNLNDSEDGLIPLDGVHSNDFVLEQGILATIDVPAGGAALSGDYWCFVARTADADIERLEHAAPAGVHRHYCKLAILETSGEVVDCRSVFSALAEIVPGCCSAVVKPGEDIQAALDGLPASGGCVCLRAGEHEISRPLRIAGSNISLRGETLGARLVRNNGVELLEAKHPAGLFLENVCVSDLVFAGRGDRDPSGGLSASVRFERCIQASFERCRIRVHERADVVGVRIRGCDDVQIAACDIAGVGYAVWAVEDSQRLVVRDNILDAFTRASDGLDGGLVAVFVEGASDGCVVERNRISRFNIGIADHLGPLGGIPVSGAGNSLIAGNSITRLGGEEAQDSEKIFAIDLTGDDAVVRGNELVHNARSHGGIVVSGSIGRIEDNRIRCLATEAGDDPSIGILIGRVLPDGSTWGSSGGRVAGNHLYGPLDGIMVFDNSGIEIEDNRLESELEARNGILLSQVQDGRVRTNRVTNARLPVSVTLGARSVIAENLLTRGGVGVTALIHGALEVVENRIDDMYQCGCLGFALTGFVRIADNQLLHCGYRISPGVSIAVSRHLGELHIESCEMTDTGVSPDGTTHSAVALGIAATLVLDLRVQSNLVTYADASTLAAGEHRALLTTGYQGFGAHILGNKLIGPGNSALIEVAEESLDGGGVARFERVFFTDNFCWHLGSPGTRAVSVSLKATNAVVMGNQFKSEKPLPSVDFHDMAQAVYLGNLAQLGPTHFSGVPTASSNFNQP